MNRVIRRSGLSLAVVIFLVFLVTPSFAVQLLYENFDSTYIQVGGIDLRDASNPKGLNTFLDFPDNRWSTRRVDSSGVEIDYFGYARHVPQEEGGNTNLLMYGEDAGGIGVGSSLQLQFDYIANYGGKLRVVMVGMNYGEHYLDPYAPWLDGETATGLPAWDVQWAELMVTFSLIKLLITPLPGPLSL